MTQDSPTIADGIAAELDTFDQISAENAIAVALVPVAKWAHSLRFWFNFFALLMLFISGACFFVWKVDLKPEIDFYSLAMIFLSFVFLVSMFPQVLWRRLEKGSFLGWCPSIFDSPDLIPLRNFMKRCADGEIKIKDGANNRVDKVFFRNIISVLLASDLEQDRVLVKTDYLRRRYRRQLRIERIKGLPISPDQTQLNKTASSLHPDGLAVAEEKKPTESDGSFVPIQNRSYKDHDGTEPILVNKNSDHQWLVAGSRDQYEAARDKAVDKFIPSQQTWKKFVLDGGRYELRSGGQTGAISATVKEIKAELTRVFGNDRSPSGQESDALIKRMLSSGKANFDITRHFRD